MRSRSVSFATALGALIIVGGVPSLARSSPAPRAIAPPPRVPRPAASPAKDLDSAGFIRPWLVLEPIRVPPQLSEGAVQAVVKKTYFEDQLTVMPHDGQSVTVDGEPLVWHAVDTPDYNVNLFHFAYALGKPTSNVLFWTVTVVDAPRELSGVRLAIGSNAASVWWLNGEEVIGLYNDRQTVIDDGISKRVTLRKGVNVIRAAIVNGGGATDFCARFIDEDGNPVKGFTTRAARSFGQQPGNEPYLDPNLSPERRAADLVSRMALEEKVLQMQSTAPAISRLGVAAYNWWNEALHGVAQGRATVFPQAIGLAAAWDTDLMHRVADIISTEARAKYNDALTRPAPAGPDAPTTLPGRTAGLTYWSPNVNIFRDPRWGRGQETYGEDPYLTGRMAVAFVRGMQGDDPRYLKVVSTPKHYAVHSGPEPERHGFDAQVSEYDLVNTYLPAFRTAVIEGKADSIMCVYNSVDGTPGCASADLLQRRLRDEWGFRGYVVSDCGAVKDIFQSHKFTPTLGGAAVAAVKAGTDLTCGTEYGSLVDEVKAGRITEAEIDRSLARLFEARVRLGMFDPQELVPYSKISISENDSSAHRLVARDAEREAIVLLKNEGGVLPLSRSVEKIAVIGPSADDPVALLGNYHGISSRQVTPLEALERQFPAAQVHYALGATYTGSTHALVPAAFLTPADGHGRGVLAEYFDNPDLQGEPKLRRSEPRPYFDIGMEDAAVVAALGNEKFSVRWTAMLAPPATGDYDLIVRTGMWNRTATARLFLDDKEVMFGTEPSTQMTSTQAAPPGPRRPVSAHVPLEGGRKYALRVEYRQPGSRGTVQLGWIPPAGASLAEAEALVKASDVAIVFVGLSSELEGEEMRGVNLPGFLGGDRTSLDLPEPQEKLVKAAIATGKPVVVVLTSGSAIAANSAAERAAALLAAWYGGEEAGTAIAETLAGVNNPAGRLPVTFYKSVEQLPAFTDYAMKGRTYRYFKGEPLYPFGFGLSYSTFAYSGLFTQRTAKGAEIRATVKNTSARDGDEVVQLYVGGGSEDGAPIRNLRGFQRIHLPAGESREVTFTLRPEDLPKSSVEVSVGGGQPVDPTPHVRGSL